jgi:regulator of protease activity HflC (stomatin/prohibitin superfamily)
MTNQPYTNQLAQTMSQLAQIRASLEDASEVFGAKDSTGRTPIVVIPKNQLRIRWGTVTFGVLLVLFGTLGAGLAQVAFLSGVGWLGGVAVVLGILLIVLGLARSLFIQVPEGANALLARGGKHVNTVGPGLHIVPPWVIVSHLVTRKEIPYDAPVKEAPTRDNVRATVDTSITFMVTDPYKFVYGISASGFDQVFQAACQDALRSMVRAVTSDQINDLAQAETAGLRETLSRDVEQYGVTITKINITDARPPAEFLRSQEERQLAVLQRAEQSEKQALAQRRQTDEETLARQKVEARVERERLELEVQVQQAQARRRVAEMEAEAEMVRFQKMEEGLRNNPRAAQRELALAQFDVAKALAGNSRAILQVGSADDMVNAFVMRDLLQDVRAEENGQTPAIAEQRPAPRTPQVVSAPEQRRG